MMGLPQPRPETSWLGFILNSGKVSRASFNLMALFKTKLDQ
jgi:hypothetical protein